MKQVSQRELPEKKVIQSIREELERMESHPLFSNSAVLKRFLHFIVSETLDGRANCLKEYTIATAVLNRSPLFQPKQDGIVRVHANRLRKTIAAYYREHTADSPVRISIPKGSYIPVFLERRTGEWKDPSQNLPPFALMGDAERKKTIAVLPFHCNNQDSPTRQLADDLGLGLSNTLMKLKSVKVLSYHLMRLIPPSSTAWCEWVHGSRSIYLITGNVQYHNATIRVTVQLAKSDTAEQLWTGKYEADFHQNSPLDIEDRICQSVLKTIRKRFVLPVTKQSSKSLTAVA